MKLIKRIFRGTKRAVCLKNTPPDSESDNNFTAGEIVYFTRFLPTIEKGGGSRRMMQIWEVLKGLKGEAEVVSAQRKDCLSKEAVNRIEENITFASENEYLLWSEKRRHSVCRLGEISREWSRNTKKISCLKLAIMDDPIYFVPLFEKLRHFNVPIIAICHNLETLAPEQVIADPRRSLFSKEIDLLAQCHMVITISREETFLLRNLGVNTLFFPYYPVEPILNRLLQVRGKRKKTNKEGILLLGNVLNVQTRQGMEKVIYFWEANRLFQEQGKLIVAGYGTGQYIKKAGSSGAVEFLGTLTNDELDSRLIRVKACLCFQESGSGALTRICEMLIAGVPVLANSHAARSYYNHFGVVEFPDLHHLKEAFKKIECWEGEITIPSAPSTSQLVSGIRKIITSQ